MSDGSTGEKTEEPTPERLRKLRKEGNIPKSQDVSSAVSFIVVFAVLAVSFGFVGEKMSELFEVAILPRGMQAPSYHRRRPEETALHLALMRGVDAFIGQANARGREVPRFIETELRCFHAVEDGDTVRFNKLGAPDDHDVQDVAWETCVRTLAYLRKPKSEATTRMVWTCRPPARVGISRRSRYSR